MSSEGRSPRPGVARSGYDYPVSLISRASGASTFPRTHHLPRQWNLEGMQGLSAASLPGTRRRGRRGNIALVTGRPDRKTTGVSDRTFSLSQPESASHVGDDAGTVGPCCKDLKPLLVPAEAQRERANTKLVPGRFQCTHPHPFFLFSHPAQLPSTSAWGSQEAFRSSTPPIFTSRPQVRRGKATLLVQQQLAFDDSLSGTETTYGYTWRLSFLSLPKCRFIWIVCFCDSIYPKRFLRHLVLHFAALLKHTFEH